MYLRTPKRYQANHRRRHLFSTRWLWLWVVTPLILIGGWQVYEHRDQIGPPVRQFISNTVDSAKGGLATMVAPTGLPTTDPAERIVRGDNAWSQGAIEQAITEYGAAADSAPNDERVHYLYTYGLLIEHENQQALSAAESTVTADPFSSDAWAIRALALERNGQYAQAVASGLQALSLDPKNPRAMAFMAEAYLDANQPAQAEEKINQALQTDPNSAEAHYASGLWNLESNFKYDAALSDFQAAHDLAPNLPQFLVDMAWADWSLNSYDDGLAALQQVIENNPNNLDALYALGYYENQVYGDTTKAEDYLNHCLQVDANNSSCLSYLATIKITTGKAQEAAQLYQRIIDAGTTSPLDYLHAGRTYANLGDCQSATPLLRTGYNMEQKQPTPDVERLAAFEEFMSQCNIPFNAVSGQPLPSSTQEQPLLVPLGGS